MSTVAQWKPGSGETVWEGVVVRPGTRPGFVEIAFPSKPADAIREELKAAGYRWARSRSCWYGPADRLPERYQGEGETESAETRATRAMVQDAAWWEYDRQRGGY